MDRAKKEGWTLLILSPTVDLSDPFGKCMAQVAGAFAELERELIGQRQTESVAARKAAGTYKKPQKRITTRPRSGSLTSSDGMSLRGIARQLELEGYAPPAGCVACPSDRPDRSEGFWAVPDASAVPHIGLCPRSPLARAPGTSTGRCRYWYWPIDVVSRSVVTLPAPYFATRAS
jgi:hypothetical protein